MRHIIPPSSFGSWRSQYGNQGSTTRTYVTHNHSRSVLLLYVNASSWNSVIKRAKSHPEEILMFDDNGNSPLHVACQLDPPVEVLISLKDAVTHTNSWGATPLHIAASHRCNVLALRKLIEFYPGALYRLSRMHRAPIHYACMSYRGLDLIAFRTLLEQTIIESHRQKEAQGQQQYRNIAQEKLGNDLNITAFIDILREAKDDVYGYDTRNEEIGFSMIDSDSLHAVAVLSSDSSSLSPSVNARPIPSTQREEEETSVFVPYKNNCNAVTWKDATGQTPLGLLFRRYRERVKRVIEFLEQTKNSTTGSPQSSSSLQTDLGHLWGKARLIVVLLTEEFKHQQHKPTYVLSGSSYKGKCASDERDDDSSSSGQPWSQAASWSKERLYNSHTVDIGHNAINEQKINPKDRTFRIVHSSVGLTGYGCPPEMIRLAISIYPNQVSEMDENGNLPLHIAATASSLGTLTSNNFETDEESSVFSDSIASLFSSVSKSRHGACQRTNNPFDKLIKLLLKQYPQAAQTPHGRSGRLPLVLADRAGNRTWNDGMKTLVRAYPPALFSGSEGMISVKLYPYVLSLLGGGHPLDFCSQNCIRDCNLPRRNTTTSLHQRSCTNRFKGRNGMALLHNLMLLKQRHVKELMAGTCSMYGNNSVGRRQICRSHAKVQAREREDDLKKQPERKKKIEFATSIFELLQAKPDLIEIGRSLRKSLKKNITNPSSPNGNLPPAWVVYTFENSARNNQSDKLRSCEDHTKKKMNCKLVEKIKLFEQKSWKTLH